MMSSMCGSCRRNTFMLKAIRAAASIVDANFLSSMVLQSQSADGPSGFKERSTPKAKRATRGKVEAHAVFTFFIHPTVISNVLTLDALLSPFCSGAYQHDEIHSSFYCDLGRLL